MADNIGGIVQCWYTLTEDVKDCTLLNDGIVISFQPYKNWKEIPATPGRSDVQVTPADDGTAAWEAAISVSIPDHRLKECGGHALNGRAVLFKYRTAGGGVFVVGDLENFLRAGTQRLTPSSASGYAGMQINLSGRLPHSELPPL